MYTFLAERFLPYWFKKYAETLEWPVVYCDINKNYEYFDQYSLVYKHKIFDSNQVRTYLDKAYSKYYSRLGWLVKYFKSFLYA